MAGTTGVIRVTPPGWAQTIRNNIRSTTIWLLKYVTDYLFDI